MNRLPYPILAEHLILSGIDVGPDLVQDREAIIEQPVEDAVEEVAGASTHIIVSCFLVYLTIPKQFDQWLELPLMQGYEVVVAEEG